MAETANVEVPEKEVNKSPDLITSKLDMNPLDIQTKANIMSADELVTDDEHDDLEEDIVVTHL